jgi:long-chain acyl-CoA synthetase
MDDLYDKVATAKPNIKSLKEIYTFDHQEGRKFWQEVFSDEGQEEVEARKADVKDHELATLIYTSGTTGNPKGVMLSHENIISNVNDVAEIFPIGPGDTALSFLPICHIFERTASYVYTNHSIQVAFAGTGNLGGDDGDLKAVQPHFFTTVPRLLEKVYEKIYNKGLELSGVKKKLFFWALGLTNDYELDQKPNQQMKIADKLIFSKWREALGGNVRGIVSGAAACPTKIKQVFSAAGVPIREGYGLTETSPGLAIGRFTKGGAVMGAIGPGLKSVDLMIDDSDGNYAPGEGEILAKGPNIMMGYFNKPDATEAVTKEIDGEKWFCTGDIGTLIKGPSGEDFLKITDRKKELLKTSGGKYVAPAPIENKLKEDFLIEQVMVVGEKQKFVSALIVPATEALQDWCKNNDIAWTSLAEVIENPKVIAAFQAAIDEANPNFSKTEKIKKFTLVPGPWEPVKADGSKAELTPTLKLKRRIIIEKYDDVIDNIYDV